MITILNKDNQLSYITLFGKAYEVLLRNNKLKEGETISSLDDYFFHLNDLINENNVDVNGSIMTQAELFKFLMLPLDEPTLDIDINTRSIKVPATFAKCAGVEGDHYAETVMFTVDRYVDYMDLDNTIIYVQWKTEDGNEGASQVFLKDLETVPNKIRFGWVLEDPITSVPGNVKFSVRFFCKNDNNEVTYSLNTLESAVVIKPALKAKIDYAEEEINNREGANIFHQFIVNSINASYDIPNPPSFLHSAGLNLPAMAALDNDNTLTLLAQAITGDLGEIDYYWYYKPYEDAEYQLQTNTNAEEDNIGYYITDIYTQVSEDKFEPLAEKYYEKNVDEVDREVYTLVGLKEYPVNGNIYERFSAYVIPASNAQVVGEYMVKATNSRSENVTNKVSSNVCKMLAPNPIEITKTLPTGAQMQDATGVTLSIEVAPDAHLPVVSYQWKYSATSADDLENIDNATSNTLIADNPGWYTVIAEAYLNRHKEEAKNIPVCRVTARPIIDGVSAALLNENPEVNVITGEAFVLRVGAEYNKPEGITTATELLHDDFVYVWQTQSEADGDVDFRDITSKDTFVVSGLNTANLTVLGEVSSRSYRCLVYNKANDMISEGYKTTEIILVY